MNSSSAIALAGRVFLVFAAPVALCLTASHLARLGFESSAWLAAKGALVVALVASFALGIWLGRRHGKTVPELFVLSVLLPAVLLVLNLIVICHCLGFGHLVTVGE